MGQMSLVLGSSAIQGPPSAPEVLLRLVLASVQYPFCPLSHPMPEGHPVQARSQPRLSLAGRHAQAITPIREPRGGGSSVTCSHTQRKAHLASFVLKEKQQPNCTTVPTMAHQVRVPLWVWTCPAPGSRQPCSAHGIL